MCCAHEVEPPRPSPFSPEPSPGPSTAPASAPVTATCDETMCDVSAFPGDDDQKNALAIAAALQTTKLVYFPNGSYRLKKSIEINVPVVDLVIQGQSVDGVVLSSDPIILPSNCFGSMISIDRAGGFASLDLKNRKNDSGLFAHPQTPYLRRRWLLYFRSRRSRWQRLGHRPTASKRAQNPQGPRLRHWHSKQQAKR